MDKNQRVHGRIFHREKKQLWILHQGQVVVLNDVAIEPLSPGDWVSMEGLQRGPQGWTVSELVRLVPYRGEAPFPQRHSDWERFHGVRGIHEKGLRGVARVKKAIREFFEHEGFLEVDTPAMGTSPGLEVHLEAIEVRGRLHPGGAPETRWLMTSPEYHMKRLLSADFQQIYQMGKAFRSGEAGPHHNPEFTMLEWYRSFSEWRQGPADTEALLRWVDEALDLKGLWPGTEGVIDIRAPWETLSVREAIQRWAGFDPYPWDDPERLRRRALESGISIHSLETESADILVRVLVERVEPALPRDRPIVLSHYPDCMASLARRSTDVPGTAERFEIYLGGIELANGFGELTDPGEQTERLQHDLQERERLGLPAYPMDHAFLRALASGIPPAMGIALGVDRLAMAALGCSDIRQLLAFPASVA